MKIFYIVVTLCVFVLLRPGNCQDKIWFTSGGLVNANIDGSNTEGCSWTNTELYGADPAFFMQASNGDIYVANTEGGREQDEEFEGYGAISRISKTGMQHITYLGYAQGNVFMTEGIDGYIYGVRSNAFDYTLFRFKLDGTAYQDRYFSTYGMRASDLTTTSKGTIVGTTRYHLYQLKPDLSGIVKLYEYKKETGNSPIGQLHQSNDGYLYGVTKLGGSGNYGVVYRVNADGTGYTVLHQFNIANGRYPDRGLTEDANGNLYGITRQGGKFHRGVLFKLHKSGSNFEVLYHFSTENQLSYYDEDDLPTKLQLTQNGELIGEAPNQYQSSMFIFSLASKEYSEPYSDNMRITDIHVLHAIDPMVRVLRPADGAANVPVNDTQSVTNVTGASSYTVEFSTDSTFTNNVLTSTATSSSNLPRVNFAYETKYYARAKSSLWPYYGSVTSFTTRSAEDFAFITNPKDGATNVEAPILKVTANQVSGARRYVIELSTTNDFSSDVLQRQSTSDYQRTLTFTDLQYNTRYYARMKTDISNYGKVTSFTTKAEPQMLMSFSPDQMNVYPNPSAYTFTLTATGEEDADFSITNLSGKVMTTRALPAGQTIEVGSDFPKGIYILKVLTKDGVTLKRIVKE